MTARPAPARSGFGGPETWQALQVVLRSGRPARFKVLTVACPRDHVVGRVYRTALGFVLTFHSDGLKGERVPREPIYGARADLEAWLLGGSHREEYRMQCRCSSVVVDEDELLTAVEAGRKRLRVSQPG